MGGGEGRGTSKKLVPLLQTLLVEKSLECDAVSNDHPVLKLPCSAKQVCGCWLNCRLQVIVGGGGKRNVLDSVTYEQLVAQRASNLSYDLSMYFLGEVLKKHKTDFKYINATAWADIVQEKFEKAAETFAKDHKISITSVSNCTALGVLFQGDGKYPPFSILCDQPFSESPFLLVSHKTPSTESMVERFKGFVSWCAQKSNAGSLELAVVKFALVYIQVFLTCFHILISYFNNGKTFPATTVGNWLQ